MKTLTLILSLMMLPAMGVIAWGEECGDEGLYCRDGERCFEYVVAMFSGESPSAPSFVKGKCVRDDQKYQGFWCGNRQCSGGIFGSPTVCCINQEFGEAPEYACARTELNCPGNTTQLTIRNDDKPGRKLKGS